MWNFVVKLNVIRPEVKYLGLTAAAFCCGDRDIPCLRVQTVKSDAIDYPMLHPRQRKRELPAVVVVGVGWLFDFLVLERIVSLAWWYLESFEVIINDLPSVAHAFDGVIGSDFLCIDARLPVIAIISRVSLGDFIDSLISNDLD